MRHLRSKLEAAGGAILLPLSKSEDRVEPKLESESRVKVRVRGER